jgi:ubiquinone biosynthesis protein
LALLALLVYEGVAKEVYPELDFQQEAMPFTIAALSGASSSPHQSAGES